VSLKAAPLRVASSLRDASHLNIIWDISLCRWNSCNILRALPQFRRFYFTCRRKWNL